METAQPALPLHAMSASLPPPQITHTPDRQYEFELTQTGVLGSGAHGVVRVARDVNTGQAVAIKVMATSMLGSMAKELIAQSKVRHPNVVQLMGTQVDLDQKRVFMVMELCSGGELFDRIAECGKLEEDAAKRYLRQMADGISHCHALNVFHRDLKPENILLDAGDNVKIADFGLASIVRAKDGHVDEGSNFLQYTKCGSIMYAAPEVLTSSSKTGYSAAKADVWSLGIILYSMLSGALPFQVSSLKTAYPFKPHEILHPIRVPFSPQFPDSSLYSRYHRLPLHTVNSASLTTCISPALHTSAAMPNHLNSVESIRRFPSPSFSSLDILPSLLALYSLSLPLCLRFTHFWYISPNLVESVVLSLSSSSPRCAYFLRWRWRQGASGTQECSCSEWNRSALPTVSPRERASCSVACWSPPLKSISRAWHIPPRAIFHGF